MKKREEKMRGGLEALLGGTTTEPSTEQQQGAALATDGAELEQEATPQEEEDLINSIEDEELKEKLRKRRNLRRGRPRKDAALRAKQDEVYTRACWIMRRDQMAKLREISFRETLTIKEMMEEIIGNAIKAYEKKHGKVIPQEHKGDVTNLFN